MLRAIVFVCLAAAPSSVEQSHQGADDTGGEQPGDEWKPAAAPPPTAWATAGARGWRLCHELETRAFAAKRGKSGGRGTHSEAAPDDEFWTRSAKACPHAPAVLSLAAETEIVRGSELLSGVESWDNDPARLIEATAAHKRGMTQALSWLTTAIEESERRGVRPPSEAYYYRAYALTTLGEVSRAGEAIALAEKRHDVAAHRIDRMAALIHLLRGQPQVALRLAHRAVVNAPATGDRLISRFIYALILDRAGALHSAVLEFRSLHREGGRNNARIAVESVLPVHERLFLRALDHQTADLRPHADRLWQLYLSSAAPEAPERVLAQRHRAELEVRPETIDPKR